jgi:hypothetical protein
VHLEASTKPHVHNLIHEFLINMAFTMACPNFKKGLKMVSGPLGVNSKLQHYGPCKISWKKSKTSRLDHSGHIEGGIM